MYNTTPVYFVSAGTSAPRCHIRKPSVTVSQLFIHTQPRDYNHMNDRPAAEMRGALKLYTVIYWHFNNVLFLTVGHALVNYLIRSPDDSWEVLYFTDVLSLLFVDL